jgi:hypothetical protein
MSILYRGPSIDASYQVSYHLAMRFQRKSCFRNRPIRNKNCLQWPYLLTDQNGMAKRFQRRRFFRNQPIRNKNCLWRPCLLMDRDKMSNRNRGLSIDASYQVSDHLAKWFSEEKIFRNRTIRNKNCLWRPCL